MRVFRIVSGGMLCIAAPSAWAQTDSNLSLGLEIESEERRRGLSWSEGKPTVRLDAALSLASDTTLGVAATPLRQSPRHGMADAVVDLSMTQAVHLAEWRLNLSGRYHLFPGASAGQAFGEIGVDAEWMIGPATLVAFGSYAPSQSALGGDLLHLGARAALALPGTPFTLSANAGHSSGGGGNPLQSGRLLPGGHYWDHGLAVDYYRGRWSAGLAYTDTSVARRLARHAGPAIVARLGLRL